MSVFEKEWAMVLRSWLSRGPESPSEPRGSVEEPFDAGCCADRDSSRGAREANEGDGQDRAVLRIATLRATTPSVEAATRLARSGFLLGVLGFVAFFLIAYR